MKFIRIVSSVLLFYMYGCMQNPPVVQDGNGSVVLKAVWDKSIDSIPDIVPLQNAQVIMSSQYGMKIYYTGSDGFLRLNHLPSTIYSISIKAAHPADASIILVGSIRGLNIISGQTSTSIDTAKPVSSTGIAINEIYSAGPVNNIFYIYDQFVELYNSSDSVKYLDGMLVMRVNGYINDQIYAAGGDWYHNGKMQGVTYIYKFPGKPGENNYPFYPKQFLVLAGEAIDHRKAVSTSIDLSHADWEFYNQYMAGQYDNPNVPNLINMRPDNGTKFLISLAQDIVALASGKDTVWTAGIDISTIIDAVQYSSNRNLVKTIDDRIDRGVALYPPRYSGKSIQRKEPGMDTNDGSADFEILPAPTPGRQ
ncbi:MAG: DUF4876 domain-containing protein [Ignavibacteriaceae bacterium]|nr:DUF4876 domain-containing protein [Ignavibacteriaceae bacterium]